VSAAVAFGDNVKSLLATSKHNLKLLVSSLKKSDEYILGCWRIYLANLIDNLEPQLKVVSTSLRRSADISLKHRPLILQVLLKWQDTIIQWSKEETNDFITRIGAFTDKFKQCLKFDSVIKRAIYSNERLYLYFEYPSTTHDVVKLLEDNNLQQKGMEVIIARGDPIKDDGYFISGDPYINCYCESPV